MYNDLFIYYIPKFKNNYGELMKLETLMQSLWEKYLKTKDVNFLAKACESRYARVRERVRQAEGGREKRGDGGRASKPTVRASAREREREQESLYAASHRPLASPPYAPVAVAMKLCTLV